MKKLADFLWKIDRMNTFWIENQHFFSRIRYCLHEFLWEIKEGYKLSYSFKKWFRTV